MKKFFNVLICAVFVFCGALVFAACGGKGSDKDADKPKFEVDTSNATTEFHWGDKFTTDGLVVRFGDTVFSNSGVIADNTYQVMVYTKENYQAYLQWMKNPNGMPPMNFDTTYAFDEDGEYVVMITCLPSTQVIQEMSKQGILAPYILTYNITVTEPTFEIAPATPTFMYEFPVTFNIKINGKTISSLKPSRGEVTVQIFDAYRDGLVCSYDGTKTTQTLNRGRYKAVATYRYRYLVEKDYTAECYFDIVDAVYDLKVTANGWWSYGNEYQYLIDDPIEIYVAFNGESVALDDPKITQFTIKQTFPDELILDEDLDLSKGLPYGNYTVSVEYSINNRKLNAECEIKVLYLSLYTECFYEGFTVAPGETITFDVYSVNFDGSIGVMIPHEELQIKVYKYLVSPTDGWIKQDLVCESFEDLANGLSSVGTYRAFVSYGDKTYPEEYGGLFVNIFVV